MSWGVNIIGIEHGVYDAVHYVIERAARRGKQSQFVLYIQDGYLRFALENSPRFDRIQDEGDYLGVYTCDIDPDDLAGDILCEVQQYRGQHEYHRS